MENGFCTTGPPLSLRVCPVGGCGGLLEDIELSAAVLATMLVGGGARTRPAPPPAAPLLLFAPPPPLADLSIRSFLFASSSSVDRFPTDILALISSFNKIWFSSRATVSADSNFAFSAARSSNSADRVVYQAVRSEYLHCPSQVATDRIVRASANLQLLQSSRFVVGLGSDPGELLQLLLKLLHLLRQVLGGHRLLRAAPLLLLLAHLGQGALSLPLHTYYVKLSTCTICTIRFMRRTALCNASLLRCRSNCTISSEASTAASSCSIFCCISCSLLPPPTPPPPMMDMDTGLERLA